MEHSTSPLADYDAFGSSTTSSAVSVASFHSIPTNEPSVQPVYVHTDAELKDHYKDLAPAKGKATHGYQAAMVRALKSNHVNVLVQAGGVKAVDGLLNDTMNRVMEEANFLAQRSGRKIILDHDVQAVDTYDESSKE
ncbi:hypothetical protein DM01DRAFT_1382181 [Hesseltinella vesiculosa]|uniref:Uncharacterized protein n=1 Tax=Hesseltinella vesiculosa TaxID=101127 RepID=A0A1X2GLK0_9FUNG|nr:hypothetical protein DM01DRAFT_1382181 [Hesseltinella vesiculosa]